MFVQKRLSRKFVSLLVLVCFLVNIPAPYVFSQNIILPVPGKLLSSAPSVSYPFLKGIKLNPKDPFKLEFIIDSADKKQVDQVEAEKLVRYFLAALTLPEDDLWVNLSPYEAGRIIPDELAQTEMGEVMLAQDYVLKQLAASLTYPETVTGSLYWRKLYRQLNQNQVNVIGDSFSKVWIVPKKAKVYQEADAAYLVESELKVMVASDQGKDSSLNEKALKVMRETILPDLEREVNSGEHFAALRQIYSAFILAAWFKKKLKDSVYRYYIDQKKISGIDIADQGAKDKIYQSYLKALKQGAYNYIRKEYDLVNHKRLNRRYYSGGIQNRFGASGAAKELEVSQAQADEAKAKKIQGKQETISIKVGEKEDNFASGGGARKAVSTHDPEYARYLEGLLNKRIKTFVELFEKEKNEIKWQTKQFEGGEKFEYITGATAILPQTVKSYFFEYQQNQYIIFLNQGATEKELSKRIEHDLNEIRLQRMLKKRGGYQDLSRDSHILNSAIEAIDIVKAAKKPGKKPSLTAANQEDLAEIKEANQIGRLRQLIAEHTLGRKYQEEVVASYRKNDLAYYQEYQDYFAKECEQLLEELASNRGNPETERIIKVFYTGSSKGYEPSVLFEMMPHITKIVSWLRNDCDIDSVAFQSNRSAKAISPRYSFTATISAKDQDRLDAFEDLLIKYAEDTNLTEEALVDENGNLSIGNNKDNPLVKAIARFNATMPESKNLSGGLPLRRINNVFSPENFPQQQINTKWLAAIANQRPMTCAVFGTNFTFQWVVDPTFKDSNRVAQSFVVKGDILTPKHVLLIVADREYSRNDSITQEIFFHEVVQQVIYAWLERNYSAQKLSGLFKKYPGLNQEDEVNRQRLAYWLTWLLQIYAFSLNQPNQPNLNLTGYQIEQLKAIASAGKANPEVVNNLLIEARQQNELLDEFAAAGDLAKLLAFFGFGPQLKETTVIEGKTYINFIEERLAQVKYASHFFSSELKELAESAKTNTPVQALRPIDYPFIARQDYPEPDQEQIKEWLKQASEKVPVRLGGRMVRWVQDDNLEVLYGVKALTLKQKLTSDETVIVSAYSRDTTDGKRLAAEIGFHEFTEEIFLERFNRMSTDILWQMAGSLYFNEEEFKGDQHKRLALVRQRLAHLAAWVAQVYIFAEEGKLTRYQEEEINNGSIQNWIALYYESRANHVEIVKELMFPGVFEELLGQEIESAEFKVPTYDQLIDRFQKNNQRFHAALEKRLKAKGINPDQIEEIPFLTKPKKVKIGAMAGQEQTGQPMHGGINLVADKTLDLENSGKDIYFQITPDQVARFKQLKTISYRVIEFSGKIR